MTLSELFTYNYTYLNTVAKRITRCKNVHMAADLLNDTYLVIHEKQEAGLKVPENNDEFVKWFSKCMSNYFKWPNSSFNKLFNSKESLTIDNGYFQRNDERLIDQDALRDIEILVEDTNDFTKELFEISSSMGAIKTLKYIELVEFKRTLPSHEKILFELYYEKELSTRDIATLYSSPVHKMNYQSVNNMVNKIKDKINTYKWKS